MTNSIRADMPSPSVYAGETAKTEESPKAAAPRAATLELQANQPHLAALLAKLDQQASGPELPPPGAQSTPTSATQAKLESACQSGTVDPGEILATLHELLRLLGNVAREQRDAETEARVEEMRDAIQKMRDAAADDFLAAVIGAAVEIGMSAFEMGMSLKSLSSELEGLKAQQEHNTQMEAFESELEEISEAKSGLGPESAEYKTLAQQENGIKAEMAALKEEFGKVQLDLKISSTQSKIFEAKMGFGRKLTESAAHIAEAKMKEKAEEARADGRDLEAEAQLHGEKANKAQDWANDLKELMKEIRDLVAAIDSSNNQTARNIVRNI